MIVITGMHRSGTSLVASLVASAGYNPGTDLIPPDINNPHGYYERWSIMSRNDKILHKAGGNWHEPPMEEQIKGNYELNDVNMVKDPRFCLTFPAWNFNGAQFIKVKRNKRDTILSLINRSFSPRFTEISAGNLYDIYNKRMDKYLPDAPVINYENLIAKDVRALQNIVGEVDVNLIGKRGKYNVGPDLKLWLFFSGDTGGLTEKTLEDGCAILDKNNIKYWLAAGTLLGIHRDGRLIPNDLDVDVEVYGKFDRDILRTAFFNEGWWPVREMIYKGITVQMTFCKGCGGFDIYFLNDNLEVRMEGGTIRYPKGLLQGISKIEYKGHKYPVPPIEEYLALRYWDWRTPEKKKAHWWEGMPCLNYGD